jgi:hypothetical protein
MSSSSGLRFLESQSRNMDPRHFDEDHEEWTDASRLSPIGIRCPHPKNGDAGLGGGDIYQEAKRDIKGCDAKYFYPF